MDSRARAFQVWGHEPALLSGTGPARFRVEDFSLRRMSRSSALRRMLGATASEPGGLLRRTSGFAAGVFRNGLSNATDVLYRDYRRRLSPGDTGSYAYWVARYDTLTSERMEELRARAESLGAGGPLFSILLPIYQTPERWLRRYIESVLAQVYPTWQLGIVDDASPDMRDMVVVIGRGYGGERVLKEESIGGVDVSLKKKTK